ncbi:MAG TPA: restriction endonuclease [Armatimonadetes bacterium]|jgi:hypothetical protein|nr:restriction endonuclease [Armatimonadota bacterium]
MTDRRAEFGDFQTPLALARDTCRLLAASGVRPRSLIEPTCGTGTFIVAALETFRDVTHVLGMDIRSSYVEQARHALEGLGYGGTLELWQGDFFETDWSTVLSRIPQPVLVVGNPPWVTNSELGALRSCNVPHKANFNNHAGIEAITGKSNFDISEWMINKLLETMSQARGTVAMLCKTSVARKALAEAWRDGHRIGQAKTYAIDAATHFGVAVDACLLVCESAEGRQSGSVCGVHASLWASRPQQTIGYRHGDVVSDAALYDRWRHLEGSSPYLWRSGVKHDCAKIMELRRRGDGWLNGLGEQVTLEDSCLFPMLKSSDVANGREPTRWMLVPQREMGEDTSRIRRAAPRTWAYLARHAERLDARASTIYRKRPRFSVFGIGPYTFAPWKVAVAGFYRGIDFRVIGPQGATPVVFDDTVYFLPCATEAEAQLLARLLNAPPAQSFISSLIFHGTKRPITAQVLRRLDLCALARELGQERELIEHAARNHYLIPGTISGQQSLPLTFGG